MLNSKNFECNRKCGMCCKKYTVLLSDDDIKRIKELGYAQENFADVETIGTETGRAILKRNQNTGCVFLKKSNDEIYSCRIYENRPEICKKYPFFGRSVESCIPVD